MMNKEKYERTDLEVIEFKTTDVLLASKPDDEYEGENFMGFIKSPVI